MYESMKKDLVCEIQYIEDKQFNFTMDDMKDLLEIDDLEIFKKYFYYVNVHRIEFLYINSFKDGYLLFKSLIESEDEITKNKLLKTYLKHEYLFCDKKGVRKLELVPKKYYDRIVI